MVSKTISFWDSMDLNLFPYIPIIFLLIVFSF